jgi:hypothetical protein
VSPAPPAAPIVWLEVFAALFAWSTATNQR